MIMRFKMKRIYIGNLSFNTDEELLRQTFEQFGQVDSVSIIEDKVTKKSKGFGFVEMPSDDEAFKAIENLNGKLLDRRKVRVNVADARR